MLASIQDILIIARPENLADFQRFQCDGSIFAVNLQYAVQPSSDCLRQAFIIGESFISGERCALVSCDNIYFGQSFGK